MLALTAPRSLWISRMLTLAATNSSRSSLRVGAASSQSGSGLDSTSPADEQTSERGPAPRDTVVAGEPASEGLFMDVGGESAKVLDDGLAGVDEADGVRGRWTFGSVGDWNDWRWSAGGCF